LNQACSDICEFFACTLRLPLGLLLVAGILLGAPLAFAQTPSPEDIASGMRIYRQKAGCQACHGWAADGRKMDSQMPDGANLRVTKLNREGLIKVIQCGRPGRQMPAFDKFAYTDARCYGQTQADLDRMGLELPHPAATLQLREINLLVDFLFAKVIGKGPMDHAKCVDYWGSEVEVCKEFPQ
jgi:mono/diheme cytochrome c family protein